MRRSVMFSWLSLTVARMGTTVARLQLIRHIRSLLFSLCRSVLVILSCPSVVVVVVVEDHRSGSALLPAFVIHMSEQQLVYMVWIWEMYYFDRGLLFASHWEIEPRLPTLCKVMHTWVVQMSSHQRSTTRDTP